MRRLLLLSWLLLPLLAAGQAIPTTPNLSLYVPVQGTPNWGAYLNQNFTVLDLLLSGHTQLPAISVSGVTTLTTAVITDLTVTNCTGCGSGGGGGTGNLSGTLTAGKVPVASTTNTVIDSQISDDGTTMGYGGSGGISLNASGASLVQLSAGAFSGLPTCNSGAEGTMSSVTDSTTATWGATITGSGGNHVLAYCNGTNWTVMAK